MASMGAYLRKRLIIASSIFLSCGTVYNEIFLGHFNPISIVIGHYPLTPIMVGDVRRVQLFFILFGLVCLGITFVLKDSGRIDFTIRRRVLCGMVSVLCFLSLLILIAELSISPFLFLTRMHIEDKRLGWKMNPGVTSVWDGVMTSINYKGGRGTELDYDNTDGVTRILYLGDSVIFGYRIEHDRNTVPELTEQSLNGASIRTESINSGVCGYSPWQEYEYLRSEGIRYDPDLVVVSIVLNDFTDKLFMSGPDRQFKGFELFLSQPEKYPLSRISHIVLYARFLRTAFDLRHYMVLNRRFTKRPEHNMFNDHWEATLSSIDKICAFCRKRNIKVLFVLFPAAWQLQDDHAAKPQARIRSHLEQLQVSSLDLLPTLRAAAQSGKAIDEYFMDVWHLTPKGNTLIAGPIAESIASILRREGQHQP